MSELEGGGGPATGSLGWYLHELVARLADGEPGAALRLVEVAGGRCARVGLGDEVVATWFDEGGRLHVVDLGAGDPPPGVPPIDGEGRTDPDVVLAILDGVLEVTDAVVDGAVQVRGDTEAVAAMAGAIEILLDGATRVPALRELAADLRTRHPAVAAGEPRRRRTAWPRAGPDRAEAAMLRDLGLDIGPGPSTMDPDLSS